MSNEIKKTNDLSRIVADFSAKYEAVEENIASFQRAVIDMKMNCVVLGTYSGVTCFNEPYINEEAVKKSIRSSAWRCVYSMLQIDRLASAKDKERFQKIFEEAPEFTKEAVAGEFRHYIENPRQNILRGMAEVFCSLDAAYKSHSKVKIGVKGLPKRVIIGYCYASYGGYGAGKLRDILNALAQYQGLPLVEYAEINAIFKDGEILKDGFEYEENRYGEEKKTIKFPARGIWLKLFKNRNAHLFFSEKCLRDINMALAEFYGDVLPDVEEDAVKPQRTAIAKDLQFYRTPDDVADRLIAEAGIYGENIRILEPSCGDGSILDAIKRKHRSKVKTFGYEVHAGRAETCRRNGHSVVCANFLQVTPEPIYDYVLMNPPFYGKHYAKHVRHAMKFLKKGGRILSILPATARYDHNELDDIKGSWLDLPVGSFSSSGTNVNTTIFSKRIN